MADENLFNSDRNWWCSLHDWLVKTIARCRLIILRRSIAVACHLFDTSRLQLLGICSIHLDVVTTAAFCVWRPVILNTEHVSAPHVTCSLVF